MTEKEAAIFLNLVPGLGSIKIKRLRDHFGSFSKIARAPKSELLKIEGITIKIAETIVAKNVELDKELELIQKNKIQVLTLEDQAYPENLKSIYDPPAVLYVKGSLHSSDALAIAVVGSRYASLYGLTTAEKFAWQLSGFGFTIVSGLARGIDSAAHKGALKAKGRTIAVLGSGLLEIYPPENIRLFEQIAQNGAVVSEFPLRMQPLAANFPRRNRIISGLSYATLVVEAARKSGALITADSALEQGRDVFAVPGKVDSLTSWGTHHLIKQGAKLVNSVEDIVEELKPKIKIDLEQIKSQDYSDFGKFPLRLTSDEQIVYNLLSSDAKHMDAIIAESRLSLSKIMPILLGLEMKHLVRQLPGKVFTKV